MTQIIPWRDLADFTQDIRLSGEIFSIRGRWNSERGFWTMDIHDKNDAPLLIGQKIVLNTDILMRYRDPRLPPGSIFAVEAAPGITKIGRNDIGTNVFLVYEA
ncbi:phage baseplate plug protein [Rufibacter sediminis]|uniref:Cyanophage baseplate Pam3 plug gp18 domain-containing protein n=1 Tax=Rufibacter sediminis TaxID=2762756 RepID=A0ABR6VTX5_9BACT|nr:hypothetical protein [Rufibacter sediminis]MBC3540663.1 hypothetical protein [Rufibacter sediminis]